MKVKSYYLIPIILIFLFLMWFGNYKNTLIRKDDLSYVTKTYDTYKASRGIYKIYCKDQSKYNITEIVIDRADLDKINKGDQLIIGVKENTIIELNVNGQLVLDYDTFHQEYIDHCKVFYIVVPIFMLFLVGIPLLIEKILIINEKKTSEKIALQEQVVREKGINDYIYETIQKNIWSSQGFYYCNILEQLDDVDIIYTFYMAIIDYLDENQIYVMLEQSAKNNCLAFIFYKLGDKLSMEMCFRDDPDEPFVTDSVLCWYYPDVKTKSEEQKMYLEELNKYILENPELLKMSKNHKC